MFRLKITLLILLVAYSCSFCATAEMRQAVENSNAPTAGTPDNKPTDSQVAVNSATSPSASPSPAVALLFQTKPRRQKIQFPQDCDYQLADAEGKDLLNATCFDALYDVQPDLPDAENVSPGIEVKCAYAKERNSDRHFDFAIYKAHFYALSPNKYLVQIYCDSGAYNTLSVYLLYDESTLPAKAEVLKFPYIMPDKSVFDDFSDLDPPSDDYIAQNVKLVEAKILYGIDFSPTTKKLTVYARGNGMAEFGQYARYSFPNGKPKLEEFRAQYYWRKNSPVYAPVNMIKSPPKTWKRYYPK